MCQFGGVSQERDNRQTPKTHAEWDRIVERLEEENSALKKLAAELTRHIDDMKKKSYRS
jgi:predicted RNase H-like nuclease (RuvC/YqgF family)